MLDRDFTKEIRACNGDGSREAKFAFLAKLDVAKCDLSTLDVTRTFMDCVTKHGRAVVAICVAATLQERQKRLDRWKMEWADAVLECWTNRAPSNVARAVINDGLRPSKIQVYAGQFIRLTEE